MIRKDTLSLAERLSDACASRRIDGGRRLIDSHASALNNVAPDDHHAPQLFYVLACWLEHSTLAADVVRRLASSYTEHPGPNLSLRSWGWIEAGKALLAYHDGQDLDVDTTSLWVRDNAFRLGTPPELIGTVNLTQACSMRRRAQYPVALEMADAAIGHYEAANLPKLAGVAKVTKGWLLMQLGDLHEATQNFEAAQALLKDTEDWTNQGNIEFAIGRRLSCAARDDEALSRYKEAASLYERSAPPHRNLRRTLLSLADLELRMASKNPERAGELVASAAGNIARAKALLLADPSDCRNRGRLFLTEAYQAIYGSGPNLNRARRLAKEAFKLAKDQHDSRIMARARLRQAAIEKKAAECYPAESPAVLLSLACQYANEAVALASQMHDTRLEARCHTVLGNLYLDSPYSDTATAERETEAAIRCMSNNEESDHIVDEIRELHSRLQSNPHNLRDAVIYTVTAGNALGRPLEATVQSVERAIVLNAYEHFGCSVTALCKILHTGLNRIEKHLSAPRCRMEPVVDDPDDPAIFRVTSAVAFTQPLELTIQVVERTIVREAVLRHDGNLQAVRRRLHIGYHRLSRHFVDGDTKVSYSTASQADIPRLDQSERGMDPKAHMPRDP